MAVPVPTLIEIFKRPDGTGWSVLLSGDGWSHYATAETALAALAAAAQVVRDVTGETT